MSPSARSTTANQAEYVGLLSVSGPRGTTMAALGSRRRQHASAVSTSGLPTAAQRPPRTLYQDARLIPDRIRVLTWTHLLQAWNTMANAAANLAMDCKRSMQTLHPSDRSEWLGIHYLLAEDLLRWRIST